MWQQVLTNLISIESLMALVLGVVGGMIIGALPGLNATMAISLLIPITYSMAPHAAFIMMMAVYTSAFYGGSLTAILIHTPGTPSSAATAGDGYALTKKPDVIIKVSPEKAQLIETRTIDGTPYILIEAADEVEINGILLKPSRPSDADDTEF